MKYSWLNLAILVIFAAAMGWFLRLHDFDLLVKGLTQKPTTTLQSTSDRTNVLIIGVGGEGHEGGDLTDTLIVASLYHPTNKITLIPLPRDIYLTSRKEKINAVVRSSGLSSLSQAVESITGLKVHYYFQLDFSGFVQIVDAIGGIKVDVAQSFDDYKYPIPGKETATPESLRYEHLQFTAGPQMMDGSRALKYVRSRHSQGSEGTDFARSQRQLKVIEALKDKILSAEIILSPSKIQSLWRALSNSYQTDISFSQGLAFLKSYNGNLTSISIVDLLYNPPNLQAYSGQWVLIPLKNWETIHAYVQENLAK